MELMQLIPSFHDTSDRVSTCICASDEYFDNEYKYEYPWFLWSEYKGLEIRYSSIISMSTKYSRTQNYRKTSNIRRTLVGNNIVDHSDVVGASPAGAAPTTSSFST